MTTSTDNTQFLRRLSNQMADAVERVSPAIVQVNGRQQRPASGVVYAQDFVLTAAHVLERDVNLTIQTADKRTLPAQLVGQDQTTDLAVLRVANLGAVGAAETEENIRVGQLVIAVGRSNEEGPMASSGIVSAIGGPIRSGRGSVVLERYIRTDAIPYPGFSGGPLVDTQGKVIGILTTGLINSVTLAIPMNIAKKNRRHTDESRLCQTGLPGY
jgi:S1-C subfamily serine protease